jgi:hypothetical protein
MIQYPEGLPYPLRDGYDMNTTDPAAHTPLANGQIISRRRFSNVPTFPSVTWEMDDGQAQLFMAWHQYTLNEGVEWFDCPLKTPIGIDTYQAKFKEMYSGPTLVGISRWRFRAVLQLLKRPIIDKDWLIYAPEYVLYSNIVDLAANREWPEA